MTVRFDLRGGMVIISCPDCDQELDRVPCDGGEVDLELLNEQAKIGSEHPCEGDG